MEQVLLTAAQAQIAESGKAAPAAVIGRLRVAQVERKQRKKTQAELMIEFRKDIESIKGLRISFQDMSARGLTARHRSQPVEFNLRGFDYVVLESMSQKIMARLEKTGLVVDLDNNYRTGMPEVRIIRTGRPPLHVA